MQHEIKPAKNRIQINMDDWEKIATEKFGSDPKKWQFKCPSCGGVQTLSDFIENKVPEPGGKFYFSCIGRWVKDRGCDWTLGGLFQIHTTEVIPKEGKPVPVFEFA